MAKRTVKKASAGAKTVQQAEEEEDAKALADRDSVLKVFEMLLQRDPAIKSYGPISHK